MTSFQIQQLLYKDLMVNNKLLVPNYTPTNWWECDFISVTKADYWTEYEIKLSKSDFNADCSKEKRDWCNESNKSIIKNKHAELELKSMAGPNRFYFVIPRTLLDKVEIPEWAGLQVVNEFIFDEKEHDEYARKYNGRLSLEEIKKAPKLHSCKLKEEEQERMNSCFYYRYWTLRDKINKQDNNVVY